MYSTLCVQCIGEIMNYIYILPMLILYDASYAPNTNHDSNSNSVSCCAMKCTFHVSYR